MKPNPNRLESGTQPIALAGRIRMERQSKGWTQRQLAAALGTSLELVARMETGELTATDEDVRRIAVALGITVEQLRAQPNISGMTKRGVG